MEMRTSKILVLVGVLLSACLAGNAFALTGSCVDCHTMHNSQDGTTVTFDGSANGMLLMAGSCAGCHADATAAATITGIPQVNAATMTTAGSGGSFAWLTAQGGGDAFAHNVLAFDADGDGTLSEPPGYTNATTNGVNADAATWAATTRLTCAGVAGCHGDPAAPGGEFGSLEGSHHANAGNDGLTAVGGTGVSVGGSFRFLSEIQGVESANYGAPTLGDHNVYSGSTDGTVDTTISALCARCHGKFHQRGVGQDGIGASSSPWLRHPTDIDMKALAATSEYAQYAFNLEAPVAVMPSLLGSVNSASGAADYDVTGGEIVTCLSCHFAHGSDQPDLLRWDYDGMSAGTTTVGEVNTGCFKCHTTKDGDATQ
jgi:predicted CXXCH cytochrome family protein